jgi:hypothetical protein
MYKTTKKKHRTNLICARMRNAKAAKHATLAAEIGPRAAVFKPPALRRVVVVIDFDFGARVDVFRLYGTRRIDSYQVQHQATPAGGMGWARFCKRLTTHYPRLLSPAAAAVYA